MKKIILMMVMVCVLAGAVSAFNCGTDTVQDADNNIYTTVAIGTQCWMGENMKVGTKVSGSTTMTDNSIIEKYCYDGMTYNCNSDGGLYQWDEMMQYVTTESAQGICPSDWHIPSDSEWHTLESYLASGSCEPIRTLEDCSPAGTRLKVGGNTGFDWILAGNRHVDNNFYSKDATSNFWISTPSGSSGIYRYVSTAYTGVRRDVQNRAKGFSVRCLKTPIISPTYSNFTSTETTNFSDVTLSSITSLTLAIDNKGKIAFPSGHSINANGEDYDSNVKIEDALIYVDSATLDSSFNSSATLTFYNIDCNKPYVFYSETASTFASILSENQRCPESLCTNIQCASNTLTVNVEHFTGYAAGTDANLTIEAEAGVKMPSDPIEFYAWYINSTDGTPISGECNISFEDAWGTWFEMDYNGSEYNYTKSSGFDAAGTHEYNVTCSSANFVTLEANDTKLVTSVDIPEFSILTLGLGLITVLAGLFIIRKKGDNK